MRFRDLSLSISSFPVAVILPWAAAIGNKKPPLSEREKEKK